MRYAILAILSGWAIGCVGGTVNTFGPFPSSPLGIQYVEGRGIIVPAGTPEPPVGDDQFLLTIRNEDDGFDRDVSENPDPVFQLVTVTTAGGLSSPLTLTLSIGPCQVAYIVFDCLDRPVQVTLEQVNEFSPVQTKVVSGGRVCYDRTFYILREFTFGDICENDCFRNQLDANGNPTGIRISVANDNSCDDGGDNADRIIPGCLLGHDCGDCGVRTLDNGYNTFTLSEVNTIPRCLAN